MMKERDGDLAFENEENSDDHSSVAGAQHTRAPSKFWSTLILFSLVFNQNASK